MADYQVWISDSTGQRIGMVSDFVRLEYTLRQNDFGWAKITIPYASLNPSWIGVDYIIEVERRPTGGSYATEWVGFERKWGFYDDRQGDTLAEISGPHMLELLDRRLIAFNTDTDYADKSGAADDVMKAYVRQNCGADAPLDEAGRPRSYGTEFTVQANATAGPTVERQAGWKYLLDTLQQISLTSVEMTPAIYFDLVYARVGGLATFEFRTYVNQIGTDRSSGINRVIFSRARENLREPRYEVDWSVERNYIYGLGPGAGSSRMIDPEKDVRRHMLTKWSRREDYQDARGELDEDGEPSQIGVATRAHEKLQASRPRVRFEGYILDTPQHPYGIEWFFGDKVTAEYLLQHFPGNITSLSVVVEQTGEDHVRAFIDSDAYATGVGLEVRPDELTLAASAQTIDAIGLRTVALTSASAAAAAEATVVGVGP